MLRRKDMSAAIAAHGRGYRAAFADRVAVPQETPNPGLAEGVDGERPRDQLTVE
jgi:hypothetical protein